MPKPRKYERIRCKHFTWKLKPRDGVWYADGRSNQLNAGRHSLGTRDKDEALRLLVELDVQRAADLGLIQRPKAEEQENKPLSLEEGRRLYEDHLDLPVVAGGARASTRKRYRTVFDKFLDFVKSIGIMSWNQIDRKVLELYAAHLERTGFKTPSGKTKSYRHKTLYLELTAVKQFMHWLIEEGYLAGSAKIRMPLAKAESERPYCWKPTEVAAMTKYCSTPKLQWLCNVIAGLACTGLRISELASLRWSDVDLVAPRLSLTDETAHAEHAGTRRRQTKSGRSRSFPIHPELLMILKRLPHTDNYVFHGPFGGRLKPDTVRNVLINEVLTPMAPQFPTPAGGKSFKDGRLHSFRHYFCSACANSGVPERMLMQWLGHADSEMIRAYYHQNDQEAQRQMLRLDLLGNAGKRIAGKVHRSASSKMEVTSGRKSPAKRVLQTGD